MQSVSPFEFAWRLSHHQTAAVVFWEGDQRGEVSFSAHHSDNTLSTQLATDDVNRDRLGELVIARLLYCKVTFVWPLAVFFHFCNFEN